jgi:hypothetical protein
MYAFALFLMSGQPHLLPKAQASNDDGLEGAMATPPISVPYHDTK